MEQPQVGERWRYRHGSGTPVLVVEITDRVVRYAHEGYPATVFGERCYSWHENFEPYPVGN